LNRDETGDASPPPPPPTMRARVSICAGLAAPIALANLATIATSIIDTLMVGRLGPRPLAALGACGAVQLVVALVFTSLFTGVQVLTARRDGQRDREALGLILGTALRLALLLATLAALTGILLPRLILPLWVHDAEVASEAARYLQWRWGLGVPLLTLLFVGKGFAFGLGITRPDAAISALAALANVGLNAVLIHGLGPAPRLGVEGAGLASALSVGLATAAYGALLLRPGFARRHGLRLRWRGDADTVRRLARLSLPRAVQALAFGLSSVPFFALVSLRLGPEALGTSLVLWRIFGVNVLLGISIGTAAATLVGRSLGEGRRAEARAWTAAALRLAWLAIGATALTTLLAHRPLLGAFALEPAAITAARGALTLLMLVQLLDATGIVLSRALTGAGEVGFVARTEVLVAAGATVPGTLLGLALLRERDPLLGAWLGWGLYVLAWWLAMLLRWRSGRWGRRAF
jgi:MATE family multidrug resistance protein